MSRCINRVTLLGRLGRDPKIFKPDDDEKFASLSLATSESWRDKQTGNRKEKTEWHQVMIFTPHIVTLAEAYLRKGSRILVEGRLQTNKWIKDDIERWTTEVVVNQFDGLLILLDKATGDGSSAEEKENLT